MTDTKLLVSAIRDQGLKMQYVAKQLGLSRQGLHNKINNSSAFTAPEIEKLCEILNITRLTDKEKIFFSK